MSVGTTGAVPEMPPGSLIRKIAWHWRYDEKRELWIGWWTLVVFYNLYGLLFFVIARTQPPPPPSLDVGSSRVDLQACKLEYSIVSPK